MSFHNKWVLAKGRFRRIYLVYARPSYIRQKSVLRNGGCHRCGNSCKILFTCPFYKEDEKTGIGACRIYRFRPQVCRTFPIDERDWEDVRLNNLRLERKVPPCGFSFLKYREQGPGKREQGEKESTVSSRQSESRGVQESRSRPISRRQSTVGKLAISHGETENRKPGEEEKKSAWRQLKTFWIEPFERWLYSANSEPCAPTNP